MRTRFAFGLTIAVVVAAAQGLIGQAPTQNRPASPQVQTPLPGPTFKEAVNLILVDVSVRDKSGAPIRGLKREDFQIFEEGKAQDITTFTYQEITTAPKPIVTATMLANAGKEKGAVPVSVATPKGKAAAAAFMKEFVEQAKREGTVRDAIAQAGLRRADVAPPATTK